MMKWLFMFLCVCVITQACVAQTSQPAPLELKLTYQNAAGRMMGQPPEMNFGEGFMLVSAKWLTTYTEKDDVYYRAWISGPADWESANTPKGDDGFRQCAYLGRSREGKRASTNFKLSFGHRPAGLSSHPEAKLIKLPEAMPLPPGKHSFTLHVERIGPGDATDRATAMFDVVVKGDASVGAIDGISDYQVFQRRNAQHGDVTFDLIGVPTGTTWKATVTKAEQHIAEASGMAATAKIDAPVGGPYVVTINAGSLHRTYKDICVGDIWVVSGQSNAVGCGYEKEFYRGPMPGVHGLNPKYGILEWTVARDGFFESTMGPWVTAAQDFYVATGVPVGLMGHAVGSKAMDYFYDADRNDPYFLRPLLERSGQGAAAFFWYQGESDSFRSESRDAYAPKLKGLVAAVRSIANNDRMMAGIVQLARYTWQKDDTFATIRETQRQYVLGDPDAVLYSTMPYEVSKTDKIHLTSPSQASLGKQIAAQMIAREQGGKMVPAGPVLKDITLSADRKQIHVGFTNGQGLMGNASPDEWYVTDDARAGFKQGGFVPIEKVTIDPKGQRVTIDLAEIPNGAITVSYGYRADIGGSLVNAAGFPAPCFVKVPANQP